MVEPLMSLGFLTDLLAMFLDVDRVNSTAVYGRVREALRMHQKYLNCVLKMVGGLTGLEGHKCG